jgi:hypothetical protein
MRARQEPNQLPEKEGAQVPSAPVDTSKTIIGVSDSMILFITAYKDTLAEDATTGQKRIYRERVDVPLKLKSEPIGGFRPSAGGCAFVITEHFLKRYDVTMENVVAEIKAQENYGLRFVFLDDDEKDHSGAPKYQRILDVLKRRDIIEGTVQQEAFEMGVMNSDMIV